MRKILLYLIAVLCLGLAGFTLAGAVYSEKPDFCTRCHEMQVPVEKLAKSPHEGIECIYCHAELNWPGMLEQKFKGLRNLLKKGVAPENIDAALIYSRVPAERCRGCHDNDEIQATEHMDHRLHLYAGFTCMDCHSRTAHGTYEERRVTWEERQRCQKCHRQ